MLIVGDVTHVPSKLIKTLKLFKSKFKDVYYCPGNHELWMLSDIDNEKLPVNNSIEKFDYVTIELLLLLYLFCCLLDIETL